MIKAELTGTVRDFLELWDVLPVSILLRVDYYKLSLVPDDELFKVNEDDLKRAGLISKQLDSTF